MKRIGTVIAVTLFVTGTFMAFPAFGNQQLYDPNGEYRKGLAALRAQDFKAAVTAFDHVISVVPKDSNIWTLMGLSMSGAGDQRGAKGAFEKAVRFNGDNVIAHGELGQTWAKLGDKASAQKELDWLQKRADECGGTCKESGDLRSEIAKLKGAL